MIQTIFLCVALVAALPVNSRTAAATTAAMCHESGDMRSIPAIKAQIENLLGEQQALTDPYSDQSADYAFAIAFLTWRLGEMHEVEGYSEHYEVGIADATANKHYQVAGALQVKQHELLARGQEFKYEAVALIDYMLKRYTKYAQRGHVLVKLGRWYEELGLIDEANMTYVMVMDEPMAWREDLATAYVSYGALFLKQGAEDNARFHFDTVIQRYPESRDFGWALWYTAMAYYNEGDMLNAFIALKRVDLYNRFEAGTRVTFREDVRDYMARITLRPKN